MARNIRSIYLLVVVLGIGPAPPTMAWTSYGHAPRGPGYQGGYREATPPAPAAPGHGQRADPPWGYPDSGRRGLGGPLGFRISRTTSPDAYILTIALDGMKPEEIQVRPQGRWLLLGRTHSTQEVRKDSFDDGRGFRRSFSYSSGTRSRRLAVPGDAIPSAMSREDGEDSIRIRIPRRGRQGAGKK